MNDRVTLSIDGVEITVEAGQTILAAADQAGVYIPRLCAFPGLKPNGSCRICTVLVNGRPQAACTTPVMKGMVIQSNTPELMSMRRNILEMLFVEGNHFCMFCEKSGNCELQAMAYRLGITAPHFPYLEPKREVDASHSEFLMDHNRCIFCGRCIQASKEFDGKTVFQYIGRARNKKVGVNAEEGLGETEFAAADRAATVCPVGCIIKKRVGFKVPIGKRKYDHAPIGVEIDQTVKKAGE